MLTKIVNLYAFDALSDGAKESAREWWRGCETQDFDTEYVFDDAVRMGALLGVEIDTRSFWGRGDGACFKGRYEYAKGAPAAIIAETSAGRDDASKGDRELLRIARGLQAIQRKNFYRLTARVAPQGRYRGMDITVYRDGTEYGVSGYAEEEITQLMRDFADWIYGQLEAEYAYRMSDENVDETIRINEYTFNENGERED